jgi:hypothetical protein
LAGCGGDVSADDDGDDDDDGGGGWSGLFLPMLKRFRQVPSAVLDELSMILGVRGISDVASVLPGYVIASVDPGPLLADLYHRDLLQFEAFCLRLVAFREFLDEFSDALDDDVDEREMELRASRAISQASRAQRARMVDDLNLRHQPNEERHDGVAVQPVFFEAASVHAKGGGLNEAVLRAKFARLLKEFEVDPDRVQITVLPPPLDPPPEPGGGAAAGDVIDGGDDGDMEPTRVMGDPGGGDDGPDETETDPGTSKRHRRTRR